MNASQFDFVIIGAGLSGLYLCKKLTLFNASFKILILEKSNSCGGRMATRRVENSKYDHGAQFITKTDVSKNLIDFWNTEGVTRTFPLENKEAVCGFSGMTQLAKKLSENLNIFYNHKAIQLKKQNFGWECLLENKNSIYASHLILTCPLPQSLDILKNSRIEFDASLLQIQYSKAIVLLIEFDSEINPKIIYKEQINHNIFSICSQQEKKLSTKPEYTIVMSEEWSEQRFDLKEEELTKIALEQIKLAFNDLHVIHIQIKKWRYSRPLNIWHQDFYSPANGLYLCGDAFGGNDLNGAIKSSESLFKNYEKILPIHICPS